MKIYANLKCNHTRKSFENYAKFLDENLMLDDKEIVVFPPSSAFCYGKYKFRQGAQNFYPCENGNFTGEIGLSMLNEFNIKDALTGHSERRNLGESDEFLKVKFEFLKEQNFNIIFCIGENLDIKNSNKTKEFLASQLNDIDLEYENLVIAYEPVWAIGTGVSANLDDIAEILEFLRTLTNAPLLYGGSVNLENISEISNIKECGGVLVGSASFEAKSFINLIKEVR